jgi:HlyD family secretion protein
MTTTHRRRRVALTIAAGAATISMTGLAASPFIKSPQQLAADTAPPQASVITAAVDQRVLNNTVVTRGRIEADARIEVTPTSIQGASVQVVTAVLVQVGQEVGAGTVLAAVSGRPLFTLPGSLPAYRDLKPGESGADIEQLQIAAEGSRPLWRRRQERVLWCGD